MVATTEITIEDLVNIGGSEWQKGEMHRVYFNGLGDLYGVETSRYNSGNISGATLDGDRISNSQARKILLRLYDAKIWFDLADGKFHGKGIAQDDFGFIVAEIKRRLIATEEAIA